MNVLDVELALDRIAAEIAAELPAHVRAAAAAQLADHAAPRAPAVLTRSATLHTLRRAQMVAELAPRARLLLRLVGPVALAAAPAVLAAHAVAEPAPTWSDLAALVRAREVAAQVLFGQSALAAMHAWHGVTEHASAPDPTWPAPLAGWLADSATPAPPIAPLWSQLAALHGIAAPAPRISLVPAAYPRCFVIDPPREIQVVLASLASPAARFAAVHELGHVIASRLSPTPLPRVVDEAVAAYVARGVEHPGALPPGWYSPLATEARARRLAIAVQLAAIERAAPNIGRFPTDRPPWALWHDPGAQAAYVEAESIADRIALTAPTLGLASAIAGEVARIA